MVGSRGLSTARRILLGSVSTALVNHAPCPVLVVRPPATTKPAAPR
ncbi:MAG: universal stress protein [Thermoplasmata archaeon]